MGHAALYARGAALCPEALPVIRRAGEVLLFLVALVVVAVCGLGDEA